MVVVSRRSCRRPCSAQELVGGPHGRRGERVGAPTDGEACTTTSVNGARPPPITLRSLERFHHAVKASRKKGQQHGHWSTQRARNGAVKVTHREPAAGADAAAAAAAAATNKDVCDIASLIKHYQRQRSNETYCLHSSFLQAKSKVE